MQQQDGFLTEGFDYFTEAFCNIPEHQKHLKPSDNYVNVPIWDCDFTKRGIILLTKQIMLPRGDLFNALNVLKLLFLLQTKVHIKCQEILYSARVKKIIDIDCDYFIFLLDPPLYHGEEVIMLNPPFA
ncbi:hypothetical protein ENUP19_0261G0010 [Entamoeba nuttalli]|uniref:Uncharacterized protein n=2 Tax=Entamoeba nuttalli TaxID=412467 RepID=K2GRP9_ENTNP|nr:hypothetical protein ENU1_191900 [Entamoeba nuttalli P19]EKE37608.1 hypothetical protein ENU1_191900 [Entamoeba nuttalli P19]|eukprot:XP_008860056.1 hypothetical protein ENU1_191900 [Entamoeba nuttalli P19]